MPDKTPPIDSLWHATASVREPLAGKLQERVVADIAVIGGGFTGLSTAIHAAGNHRRVVVLEGETIGYGASGRNGGQVSPGLKVSARTLTSRYGETGADLYRAGQEAPDFLEELIAHHGIECHWRRPGVFNLAHNRAALGAIRATVAGLREAGVRAEELSARDVQKRIGTSRYVGGLYDPRGGSVHPLELARELARVAIDKGAQIYTRSPVVSLRRERGLWVLATPEGRVEARNVVVATNAYTDQIVKNLHRTVLPVNSFQIATEPLGKAFDDILPNRETVYDSRRLILYFRRSPDGRLVLGGRASFSSSPATGQKTADYSVLTNVLHNAFPQLAEVPIAYQWTGLVCITLDFLPHYHRPEEGLHVLLGYNGSGVALSVRLGAWLGRKLSDKPEDWTIPQTVIRPFPFHRFRAPILDIGMRWNYLLDTLSF